MTKPDSRKGSSHRRSYTVEFKAKTLERLDLFSELKVKKKWERLQKNEELASRLLYNGTKIGIRSKPNLSTTGERKILGV